MKYFIANWKANKNLSAANAWISIIINQIKTNLTLKNQLYQNKSAIVICPPSTLIFPLKSQLQGLNNVFIGIQDISSFEQGSYTGETTAKTLSGMVDYAIIGHSERRKYFQETNEILTKKVELSVKYNIQPIFCVRGNKDPVPNQVKYIAYEPVYAIGTGMNEPLEKVLEMKKKIFSQLISKNIVFIYGGSVNLTNINKYIESSEIQGFLIGGASLDPIDFLKMVLLTEND